MTKRPELLDATDEVIYDAVRYADLMVLRGLLYQLTGDDAIAETEVSSVVAGFRATSVVTDPAAVALLRDTAGKYLRDYRDRGAGAVDIGPEARLHRSLSLSAGCDIPSNELELWTEQLAIDPWARGLRWRGEPPAELLAEFSVIVIGAGMGGLNAAVHLMRAGLPFTVIEKNPAVGGTWYENRYPGARVDTESRCYNHLYGVDFEYPNPYCEQSENEKYFNWVADHFDVRKKIRFDTEVTSVVWDDGADEWVVTADGPEGTEVLRSNVVISSVGLLARPNLPAISGMDDFGGRAFHTARWPADLDLAGKRVAVVGTGCTGYQLVPELAKAAEHTYVFQRTPNWCFEVPGYLAPFPPQVNWLDRNFPLHTNFMRFRASWFHGPETTLKAFEIDPEFNDPHARSPLNKQIRDQRIAFMQRKFADRPDLMAAMLPEAPPMSARPVLIDPDDSIYDALLRDDVTLVTDGIEAMERDGIRAADGRRYPVDVIVHATGFKANDFLWPLEIRGRDGKRLEDLWAQDGARAYLGTMLPGFPNFFMVFGPNTNPIAGLTVADFEEIVTRFALECIRGIVEQRARTVDVSLDAYWRYNDELDRWEATKTYKDPRAKNYYRNEHGRSAANCPIDGRIMWNWLRSPTGRRDDIEDYADVRPFFGEDLTVK